MASQESTAQIGIDVNLTKIFLRKSLESLSLVEVEADRYFICRLLLRKPSQPSCCGHQSCHSCIDGKYRLGVWVIIFCKVTRGRSVDNRVAARAVIPKGYPGDHSVDDTPIVTGMQQPRVSGNMVLVLVVPEGSPLVIFEVIMPSKEAARRNRRKRKLQQ
ncbi:uncharacterized protein [Dysidea avara]|uniref:uncharacterized protein isoform X4 n=1 Tax=Dysidea avara TaxID=196820 RepID=UPI003317C822